MEFIEIKSYDHLKNQVSGYDKAYVMLYKKGSEKSECAIQNIRESRKDISGFSLFLVDVKVVRDIHEKYGIKTVPALLEFEKGNFKNIVKGCNNAGFYTSFFESLQLPPGENKEKPQPRVTVYSTPTCTWCNTLKSYLRKNQIRFSDIDVSRDQNAAAEMVRLSGQQGVPQTVINGQVIVGFDKTRINNLLDING